MNNKSLTGTLLVISRIVLGLLLIFSGFVKGVDPLGSAYKFTDYFMAFGTGSLEFLSLPMAFILSAAEFLIGISLIMNLKFRQGAWAVLIFMSCFTVLTFILALTNPVTDCGCFGDAIIMTNWQTFIKNAILLPFVLMVFFFRNRQPEWFSGKHAVMGLLFFLFVFLAMEWYNFRHLPMLDFRPYSIGTSIPQKMTIPDGEPQDEYATVLFYEKDGEIQEFTEENFPWQDTTWKFVDSKHQLISKGYEPPIHDFTISDESGNDITSDVLSDPGFSFLLIATHLEKADKEALSYADELSAFCDAMGHSFYCMTASGSSNVQEVLEEQELGLDVYTTDEITLKTIIRANPGLLLLKEGIILAKWHYNDFPQVENISENSMAEVLTEGRLAQEKQIIIISILVLLISGLSLFLVLKRLGSA